MFGPEQKVDAKLCLRPLSVTDSEESFQLIDRNRNHLREWLGWLDKTKSLSDVQDFFNYAKSASNKRLEIILGIFCDDKIAGVISLKEFCVDERTASFGYWIGKEFLGQGIILKTCRFLANWGFSEIGLDKIMIKTATENKKSQSVALSLGARLVGTKAKAENLYGKWVDHFVFALERKDLKTSGAS